MAIVNGSVLGGPRSIFFVSNNVARTGGGATMVTGNLATVLFNDISSAWLAFSTYLIWATDFKDEPPNMPN